MTKPAGYTPITATCGNCVELKRGIIFDDYWCKNAGKLPSLAGYCSALKFTQEALDYFDKSRGGARPLVTWIPKKGCDYCPISSWMCDVIDIGSLGGFCKPSSRCPQFKEEIK
jgi:hypothetical protein